MVFIPAAVVGSTPARIADRVAAWKESAVTEILIHAGSPELLRQAAEIVLPA